MKTKNLLKMAVLAALLSNGFASCSSDDDADTTVVTGTQAALDQACADACLAAEPLRNSVLGDHMHEEGFHDHLPQRDGRSRDRIPGRG